MVGVGDDWTLCSSVDLGRESWMGNHILAFRLLMFVLSRREERKVEEEAFVLLPYPNENGEPGLAQMMRCFMVWLSLGLRLAVF